MKTNKPEKPLLSHRTAKTEQFKELLHHGKKKTNNLHILFAEMSACTHFSLFASLANSQKVRVCFFVVVQ